jgi:hypothetical protein
MDIDENAIRRRAYRIWEAEGRPPERFAQHLERARREIEAEFRRATEHAGDVEHRLNPPVQVEEALDPAHMRHPAGERRS